MSKGVDRSKFFGLGSENVLPKINFFYRKKNTYTICKKSSPNLPIIAKNSFQLFSDPHCCPLATPKQAIVFTITVTGKFAYIAYSTSLLGLYVILSPLIWAVVT